MLAMSGANFSEHKRKPAVEGGIRGLPPSTLRQVSTVVAQGTLASAGQILGGLPWGGVSRRERVQGLALAQMWAQARLLGAVMGGNRLIAEYMFATAEARP
jgi:hypothetical protein